jgi:hypothetical protein
MPLALVAAFLSSLPILLVGAGETAPGLAAPLGGLGLLPLACLPWVALMGLPQPDAHPPAGARLLPTAGEVALGLPILALAARLDRAHGMEGQDLLWTAVGAMLLAGLLGHAARVGAAAPGRGGLHGVLWCLVILSPPLLELVLTGVARGRAGGAPWAAELSAASPLGWLARRAVDPGAGGPPLLPVASALGLVVGVRLVHGLVARSGP